MSGSYGYYTHPLTDSDPENPPELPEWCQSCNCHPSECMACDACLTIQCWHAQPWNTICFDRSNRTAGIITQQDALRRAVSPSALSSEEEK